MFELFKKKEYVMVIIGANYERFNGADQDEINDFINFIKDIIKIDGRYELCRIEYHPENEDIDFTIMKLSDYIDLKFKG